MSVAIKQTTGAAFAVIAWLLVLTAVWLPWWSVRYSDSAGNRYDVIRVWLWRPVDEVTVTWAPWLTGMLVAVLALWLFVRLAGRSWHHEPAAWRRDLWVLAGLSGMTLVSALLWPHPGNFASFWGGMTYSNVSTSTWFTETVQPGLGWWCMATAFVVLAVAAATARMGDASDK